MKKDMAPNEPQEPSQKLISFAEVLERHSVNMVERQEQEKKLLEAQAVRACLESTAPLMRDLLKKQKEKEDRRS